MNNILTKYRSIWICAGLAMAITAVYYQLCSYDFVNYDDNDYVYYNSNIQAGITLKSVKWAFTTGHCANWHPLTWLSLMLDWQLFGLNAGGYHLTNLLFHIVNTLLLFIVLKEMTNAVWQSAFVAALFALHPLHVESVAWVSERKDVLSIFFWILTMWAYLRYVNRPKIGRYLLIVVFLALGLMSKPMLVTMPFILLLLDYWPLGRLITKRSLLYRLIEKIPLFILIILSSIITFIMQHKSKAVANIAEFPLRFRISNVFISYMQYIIKMIWPVKLAVFYPYPAQTISIFLIVIYAAALFAVTIIILLYSKNHRYLGTGWFWYLGTLVPVIGIVQVGGQAMADRYTYITLTGLFIIIAWGLPELFRKEAYRKLILWTSSLIVLLSLAVQANVQQRYWKNTITLCEHALKVTDNNYESHFILADKLKEQGRIDEAIWHLSEAVKIAPKDVQAYVNYGLALSAKGRLADAASVYKKGLQIAGDNMELHNNLGNVLIRTGKSEDAVKEFEKILKIEPGNIVARINLGIALSESGRRDDAVKEYEKVMNIQPQNSVALDNLCTIFLAQGKADEAVREYRKYLQIKPDDPDVLNSLGIILFQQGKTDEAFKCFTDTLRLDPNRPQAHYYIGQILAQRGKIDDAIAHLEDALRFEPNWVKPMNDLAWYLAASEKAKAHNPDRAIKLARQACEITNYTKYELLDTLAAAYASAGNFSKAIEIIEKVLELCRSD